MSAQQFACCFATIESVSLSFLRYFSQRGARRDSGFVLRSSSRYGMFIWKPLIRWQHPRTEVQWSPQQPCRTRYSNFFSSHGIVFFALRQSVVQWFACSQILKVTVQVVHILYSNYMRQCRGWLQAIMLDINCRPTWTSCLCCQI